MEELGIWPAGIEVHCFWVHWEDSGEPPKGLPAQRRQVMMVEDPQVVSEAVTPALTRARPWQPLRRASL